MPKYKNVGGQAVIEGVMMRGPSKIAVAVRKPDGEISVDVKENEPLNKRYKLLSLPIIRGAVSLFESLYVGVKTLTYSASFYDDEEEEETKFDKFIKEKFGDKTDSVMAVFSVLLSFVFAAFLFIYIPTLAASFLKKQAGSPVLTNLFEGIIRLIIFLLYMYLISKMKDIRRIFEYHGAEHKSIYCFENDLELVPENARKFSTLHPRCGTNFLFIVMIVSIVVFSFLGWPNIFLRVLSRVLLMPVVAGISYEIIRWCGKSDSKLAGILAYPGLMLQHLTTREPDDAQLEVAMAALKAVIDNGEDK